MITIYVKDFNSNISQRSYDLIVNNLDLNTIQCPFCHHYGFKKHAYYNRNVKVPGEKISLLITRLICPCCKHSHALLPSNIVPYQSIQLKDQIRVIKNNNIEQLMIENNGINEIDVYRIKHNYEKYFKQRLISFNLNIDENIILNSFNYFKRQFLQIKWRCNILLT